MMQSISVVSGPRSGRLVLIALCIVGLIAAEADAARRGRLGRLRRRGCCSAQACATNNGCVVPASPGLSTKQADSQTETVPDDAPPPPPDADGEPGTPTPAGEPPVTSPSDLPPSTQWRSLFDGESLAGWESTPFGGEGEVFAEDNAIIMKMGHSLTGVNYKGEVPRSNYEVEFEAKRAEGSDFFCGFTFPVKDSHCSLILGGWGGGIVGLSSIDGMDASENETTQYMAFETDRWYRVRLRVTDGVIQAWIDDKDLVYQNIEGRKVDTRIEVDRSQPFGFATYETTGALRDIRIRELTSDELAGTP